jgi:hypothetical protein
VTRRHFSFWLTAVKDNSLRTQQLISNLARRERLRATCLFVVYPLRFFLKDWGLFTRITGAMNPTSTGLLALELSERSFEIVSVPTAYCQHAIALAEDAG